MDTGASVSGEPRTSVSETEKDKRGNETHQGATDLQATGKRQRGNVDSNASTGSEIPHRNVRARRHVPRGRENEPARMGSSSLVEPNEALTAALLQSRGQLPLSINSDHPLRLTNTGIPDQGFLPHHLLHRLGAAVSAELMNPYSLGTIPSTLFLDPYLSVGERMAQGSSLLSGNSLSTLPLTTSRDASSILQQQQLMAIAGMNPSLLDYSASGLIPPMFGALPQQMDLPPLASSSLAARERRGLAHLSGSMADATSQNFILESHQLGIPSLLAAGDEGPTPHFTKRAILPLSTDEDENWLSEFLCFVRSDVIEVFCAGREDVASRVNSKKVLHGQIGIRCRFCAHRPHSERATRSSSFPSSVSRIYQSLTMMLRDHFTKCKDIPREKLSTFLAFRARTTQGATDSKRYWEDSARKLGMVDTPHGIVITERTKTAAMSSPPFGTDEDVFSSAGSSSLARGSREPDTGPPVPVVVKADRQLVSEYLFFLLSQVQRVHLTESERVGNRRNLNLGLPGLGCRHCCPTSRKGLCRLFPARRRTLPSKIKDLHDHLRRCTLCPKHVKDKLSALQVRDKEALRDAEGLKIFFDRVWSRLHKIEKVAGQG